MRHAVVIEECHVSATCGVYTGIPRRGRSGLRLCNHSNGQTIGKSVNDGVRRARTSVVDDQHFEPLPREALRCEGLETSSQLH